MGIDVYARWEGMMTLDRAKQMTGFDPTKGYLREAYHGGPLVTHVLMPEVFGLKLKEGHKKSKEDSSKKDDEDEDEGEEGVRIPASALRARLPAAMATFNECYDKHYPKDPAVKLHGSPLWTSLSYASV